MDAYREIDDLIKRVVRGGAGSWPCAPGAVVAVGIAVVLPSRSLLLDGPDTRRWGSRRPGGDPLGRPRRALLVVWPIRRAPTDAQVARFIEGRSLARRSPRECVDVATTAQAVDAPALASAMVADASRRAAQVQPSAIVAPDLLRRAGGRALVAAVVFALSRSSAAIPRVEHSTRWRSRPFRQPSGWMSRQECACPGRDGAHHRSDARRHLAPVAARFSGRTATRGSRLTCRPTTGAPSALRSMRSATRSRIALRPGASPPTPTEVTVVRPPRVAYRRGISLSTGDRARTANRRGRWRHLRAGRNRRAPHGTPTAMPNRDAWRLPTAPAST
jgi:hypothetical protein